VNNSYEITDAVSQILLPVDSSLETNEKLPFAANIADIFGATIQLLKIYNTPLNVIRKRIDGFAKEAIDFLENRKVNFEIGETEVNNIVSGIVSYAQKKNIDIITIMTEQGNITANRFLGPYAQQLINTAKIPVMSLRSMDYDDE